MNIGILGQGRLGSQLAGHLRSCNNSVTTWSRNLESQATKDENLQDISRQSFSELEVLVIASGSSSPATSTPEEELARTWNLVRAQMISFSGNVFYLSSGAVYGNTIRPVSELDSTPAKTPYGLAKLSVEEAFRHSVGSRFTSLRIGNIFPKNFDFGIFQMIYNRINDGSEVTFIGDPDDCRDYLAEQDLIRLLGQLVILPNLPEVINIGSGKSLPLRFFESEISKYSKGKICCLWQKRNSFDVSSTFLDNSLLREITCTEAKDPTAQISEFLRDTISNSENSR